MRVNIGRGGDRRVDETEGNVLRGKKAVWKQKGIMDKIMEVGG